MSDDGAVAGPDGKLRCPWGLNPPEYIAYHDEEWGRPLHGDTAIFERLCLEGFQSGLSWLTILRKRENFRAAFAGFDPTAVAAFGEQDVARLMADVGIVRNRSKINAAITNARATLGLPDGLDALVWKYAGVCGPDGAGQTHNQHQTGSPGVHHLVDRALELVGYLTLPELPNDVEQRRRGPFTLPEQAEQGHQREDGGKHRQHGVVGECGRLVGALVPLELHECRLGGVPPAEPADVLR